MVSDGFRGGGVVISSLSTFHILQGFMGGGVIISFLGAFYVLRPAWVGSYNSAFWDILRSEGCMGGRGHSC